MRNKLLYLHIGYWVFEIVKLYYQVLWMGFPSSLALDYTISCAIYISILFYINYFILFPKIINFRKLWTFFVWGGIYTLLFTLGYIWWIWDFKPDVLNSTNLPANVHQWAKKLNYSWDCLLYGAHEVAYFGGVSTLLRFFTDLYQNKIKTEKIKQSALQSEIDQLGKMIDFSTLDSYLKVTQHSDFKDKKSQILDLSAIVRQNLYNEDLSSEQFKTLLQKVIKLHNLSQEVQCKINFKNTKLNNEHFNEINNILRFKPSLIIISKAGVQYKT